MYIPSSIKFSQTKKDQSPRPKSAAVSGSGSGDDGLTAAKAPPMGRAQKDVGNYDYIVLRT